MMAKIKYNNINITPTFANEGIEKINVLNSVNTFGLDLTNLKILATRTILNKLPNCPTSNILPKIEKHTNKKSNLFHAKEKYCFGPTPSNLKIHSAKNNNPNT